MSHNNSELKVCYPEGQAENASYRSHGKKKGEWKEKRPQTGTHDEEK